MPGSEETLSYLTGDWRIFQLRNGHRCVHCKQLYPRQPRTANAASWHDPLSQLCSVASSRSRVESSLSCAMQSFGSGSQCQHGLCFELAFWLCKQHIAVAAAD
jgi:hypothetical protein